MPRPLKSRTCGCCGAAFSSRGPAVLYCSKSCIWKATKGPEFNAKIARAFAKQRGDAQRGKGTKGYIKRDGRHEHRLVAEQTLGRALLPGEIVHHVDGNKHNNDPSNLVVMRQGAHMREHGLGIPGMTLWWKPWEKRRCSHNQ